MTFALFSYPLSLFLSVYLFLLLLFPYNLECETQMNHGLLWFSIYLSIRIVHIAHVMQMHMSAQKSVYFIVEKMFRLYSNSSTHKYYERGRDKERKQDNKRSLQLSEKKSDMFTDRCDRHLNCYCLIALRIFIFFLSPKTHGWENTYFEPKFLFKNIFEKCSKI